MSCNRHGRAWIEATCCSLMLRREVLAVKCRGTNAGTADGEPPACRLCNHTVTAWDRKLDLGLDIEMIGERHCEIMIDVLRLPEMSRAELAWRAKKMNYSHCPAMGTFTVN